MNGLAHFNQFGMLLVCLQVFEVALRGELNLIDSLVLFHRVLASSCTDQNFLIFVVLLYFNLLVGIGHQLLSDLVVVYDFTGIGLTILSLYFVVIKILQLFGALLQGPRINFRNFGFV